MYGSRKGVPTDRDIVFCMIALYIIGKPTYEAIEEYRYDRYAGLLCAAGTCIGFRMDRRTNIRHLLFSMVAFNLLQRIGTQLLLTGKSPGKRRRRLRLRIEYGPQRWWRQFTLQGEDTLFVLNSL